MIDLMDMDFEHAVDIVGDRIAELQRSNDDVDAQFALCRSLRDAKIQFAALKRSGGFDVDSGRVLAARARQAVQLLGSKGSAKVVASIRRHEREIAAILA